MCYYYVMANWFKDFGKKIGISVVAIIVATVIATLLLTLTELIPYKYTERHMSSSIHTIYNDNDNLFEWASSKIDHESDTVIMSILSYDGDESPLNRALMAYRHHNEAYEKTIYSCFATYLSGQKVTETVSYARYWHGYQLTFKPLFALFDYAQIRIINLVLELLGTATVCFFLYRKKHSEMIIPYILSYLFMMPISIAWCMHYCSGFWGVTLGVLAIMHFYDSDKKATNNVEYIFLGIGMFTCFFDLMTYPLLTFGIPMVVLLSITAKSLKEKLLDFFKGGFFWCMGYILFWIMKWVVASLLTSENIISDGIGAVLERTSSTVDELSDVHYTPIDAISDNFHFVLRTPAIFIMIIFVAIILILPILKGGLQNLNKRWFIDNIVPLLVVAAVPFIWYSVVVNHSMLHNWFTFRVAITTLFAFASSASLISKKMSSKAE